MSDGKKLKNIVRSMFGSDSGSSTSRSRRARSDSEQTTEEASHLLTGRFRRYTPSGDITQIPWYQPIVGTPRRNPYNPQNQPQTNLDEVAPEQRSDCRVSNKNSQSHVAAGGSAQHVSDSQRLRRVERKESDLERRTTGNQVKIGSSSRHASGSPSKHPPTPSKTSQMKTERSVTDLDSIYARERKYNSTQLNLNYAPKHRSSPSQTHRTREQREINEQEKRKSPRRKSESSRRATSNLPESPSKMKHETRRDEDRKKYSYVSRQAQKGEDTLSRPDVGHSLAHASWQEDAPRVIEDDGHDYTEIRRREKKSHGTLRPATYYPSMSPKGRQQISQANTIHGKQSTMHSTRVPISRPVEAYPSEFPTAPYQPTVQSRGRILEKSSANESRSRALRERSFVRQRREENNDREEPPSTGARLHSPRDGSRRFMPHLSTNPRHARRSEESRGTLHVPTRGPQGSLEASSRRRLHSTLDGVPSGRVQHTNRRIFESPRRPDISTRDDERIHERSNFRTRPTGHSSRPATPHRGRGTNTSNHTAHLHSQHEPEFVSRRRSKNAERDNNRDNQDSLSRASPVDATIHRSRLGRNEASNSASRERPVNDTRGTHNVVPQHHAVFASMSRLDFRSNANARDNTEQSSINNRDVQTGRLEHSNAAPANRSPVPNRRMLTDLGGAEHTSPQSPELDDNLYDVEDDSTQHNIPQMSEFASMSRLGHNSSGTPRKVNRRLWYGRKN